MHASMYICVYVCIVYVCMYIYVCMYVCNTMYACMYACISICHIFIQPVHYMHVNYGIIWYHHNTYVTDQFVNHPFHYHLSYERQYEREV